MTFTFDWQRHGKYSTHWVNPPKVDGWKGFEEELRDIIPNKISELQTYEIDLNRWARKAYKIIGEKTLPDSFSRWFWTYFVACHESESVIIEKWAGYWLNLWHELHPEDKPKLPPGRFTEWEIEKARSYDFDRLVPDLRSFGHMRRGRCPFHEEKTPSFFVYSDNHFHCFGCGVHGGAIDFVMQSEKLSFPEAVRRLL